MTRWKSHAKHYQEALVYMRKRQKKLITRYKLPWPKINSAAIDGLEFNSITIIGARPGGCKTLMKDQMVREGFYLNSGKGIRVLEFSLEMVGKNSKIREFSAITKKSYKHLCSAETEGIVITDQIIDICVKHAADSAKWPIDVVDVPPTVKDMKEIIIEYMETYAIKFKTDDETLKKKYCDTVITIDHSVLLKKAKGQSTMDMLNEFGETMTELKKLFPIAFIVLSQLNRDIMNPARAENGKYGNYILESDIFGADALLQHADLLIGLDRPALRHISEYGPDRYLIDNDSILVAHIIKTRTGDTRMSFLRAEFEYMRIDEMETPPIAEVKKKAK